MLQAVLMHLKDSPYLKATFAHEMYLQQIYSTRIIPEIDQRQSKKKNKAPKMIGEKRNFSFISPIVKLIICRVHDQYLGKKIV